MNQYTKHFRKAKTTYLFSTLWILFAVLFFAPIFYPFERTGDNVFSVRMNGQEVGVCGDMDQLQELIREQRRRIARANGGGMVYIPVEISAEGEEALFGRVDAPRELSGRIGQIMENSVRDTLRHAYTVKINEYTVNLGSGQEVLSLMQAALDRYDTENKFDVELIVDPDRELNVLTTNIVARENSSGVTHSHTVGHGAGVDEFFHEILEQAEPDIQKRSFETLDYGLVDIDFGETVEIVEAYLMESELSTLEEAVAEVTADQEKEQIYEVQPGDTLSQIAEDKGLTIEELVAINATLESENSMIRAGDELTITVPEPELSVVWQARIYEEDSYEAATVYEENDSWYTTKSEVRQQPSAGFRKAAALVTYRNDREVSQEVIKEDVLWEAVPKIVVRGTKVPPTFIKPISGGRVSSGYGSRTAPTKGASTNHRAIDWATPTGTAVVASCGGTVTKAGWGSGYGYVVYIRHEDGRETRYGHLSKVLVSAGQKVSQGQKIALSGNTGRSTGPHLHFEMRINGSPVNPFNYLQ